MLGTCIDVGSTSSYRVLDTWEA